MLYAIKESQMVGVVYAIKERQRHELFRKGEQRPWQQG
jgi:hypothetical protein